MPEDAGALLVRSGLIASEQLRIAREAQASRGGTVGEHLVLAGFIDDETLTDFYRTRLMVPQVRPEQLADIAQTLIAKIPADMATEFRCIPVACDRDRNLTLAMADPSTTHTVDEISFFTGHYVVRAVATQGQIAWCLAQYYGYLTPLGEKLLGSVGPHAFPGRNLSLPLPPDPEPHREGAPGGEEDPAVPVVIENDRPSPQPVVTYHLPAENDQQIISFLREDTAPTGPMRLVRRPPTQPPELAARAGELEVPTGPLPLIEESLPAVMISPTLDLHPDVRYLSGRSDEVTGPLPYPRPPEESAGAAWDVPERPHPRADTQPDAHDGAAAGDDGAEAQEGVVLLERPKSGRIRRYRSTRLGLGFGSSSNSSDSSDRLARAPTAPAHGESDSEPPDEPEVEPPDEPEIELVSGEYAFPEATSPGDVPAETADQPTSQMDAPVPYPAHWSEPLPDHAPASGSRARTEPPDSIQTAALAAAEEYGRAHRDTIEAQPEQAVPDLIDDDRGARGGKGASSQAGSQPEQEQEQAQTAVAHEEAHEDDELSDEHWGPPGSTIPPEYLGPVSDDVLDSGPAPIPLIADHMGEDFDEEDIARILNSNFAAPAGRGAPPKPASHLDDTDRAQYTSADDIHIVESKPLRGRPASSPADPATAETPASGERGRPITGPSLSFHNSEPMTPEVVHELEESSLRLVEILRDLDQADSRNEVIDTLLEHLAESHGRVAFFVVKSGELTTWKQRISGSPIEKLDGVKLSLDEPSTFQDIVGTRLPFRGPLTDPVSRAFIAAALDHSAGEMLGLPVSVRGRVVGVLYGDTCTRRVFEQHLAVVTRAAGVALERILRAKKTG